MNKMLVVTSRNIVSNGGELSLIKNRALTLKSEWDIDTDVIALCNTNLGVAEGKEAFGKGTYVRRSFSNPVSLLSGYSEVLRAVISRLGQEHYSSVLLSGVGLLRLLPKIKEAAGKNTLLCADIHGYYGDGRLIARTEPLALKAFHTLASEVEKWEQTTFLKRFDRIFVVTNAYKRFLCDTAGCQPRQFYVVPCANGETPTLSSREAQKHRQLYRSRYGVSENETLLVYSGGASPWQCLPETVALYRELKTMMPVKLLILTGDQQGVRTQIGSDADVLMDSYQPAELPYVFCAADFCLMLRADNHTNHFAFPNKFLEYIAAHKPVITTPHLYDIAAQIKSSGVGILYNGDAEQLAQHMSEFTCKDTAFDQVIERNAFRTTLIPFAREIEATA